MNACAQLCLLACLSLTFGLTLGVGSNRNIELTFLLPAGGTECFFQTSAMNGSMEVEYQVIAGSGLDVGFTLISPSGYLLVSDFRRSDGIHMVDPTEDGDYRFCFDNSFSKLSEKIVFFDVLMNGQRDAGQDEWANVPLADSMVGYKLDDIRWRIEAMSQRLEKTRQVQAVLRAFEARDRYLLEDNLWRVSFWSCLNLLVMLSVAVTQIYTLRRLFDDKKRVHT